MNVPLKVVCGNDFDLSVSLVRVTTNYTEEYDLTDATRVVVNLVGGSLSKRFPTKLLSVKGNTITVKVLGRGIASATYALEVLFQKNGFVKRVYEENIFEFVDNTSDVAIMNEFNRRVTIAINQDLDKIIIGGGSGGGTHNYNELDNLPSINGKVIKGDLKLSDLGGLTLDDLSILLLDYLAKDNSSVYEPKDDYNPATKKYVDDRVTKVTVLWLRVDDEGNMFLENGDDELASRYRYDPITGNLFFRED